MKKTLLIAGFAVMIAAALLFLYPKNEQKSPTAYSSEKYGFSFDYPENYFVVFEQEMNGEREQHAIVLAEDTPEARALSSDPGSATEGPPTITITIFQNDLDKYTLKSFVEGTDFSNFKLSDGNKTEVNVDGETAWRYRATGLYENDNVVVALPEYVYMFTAFFSSPDDKILKDFDLLLQTVEFSGTRKFKSDMLGISFEYPSGLGEAVMSIAEPGKRPGGETGRKLVGAFSKLPDLEFGGITDDFSAGRSGLITDTRGFVEEDGKYYFKFVSAKNYKDYEIQPLKVLEKDFGKIIIINDRSFESEREGAEGPVFGVGKGNFAGLVNLKGKEFPGLAFYSMNTEEFTLKDLEALVGSISVYSPKETYSDNVPLVSKEEALKIAMDSKDCSMAGILTDKIFHNSVTKTWWIDVERMPELEKDGCNPACVVSEETRTAEVNWRCTGLREPAETVTCVPEQRNADLCTTDYDPVCAKVNVQCITTPCDPVNETFSNACEACKNPLIESYIAGECS